MTYTGPKNDSEYNEIDAVIRLLYASQAQVVH